MPAEVKRAATGVYLLFLNENVTDDDIAQVMSRTLKDIQQGRYEKPIVIIEPIQVANPLKAARLCAKHADACVAHYIVVNNARDGAVMAERLAQKLPRHVEVMIASHQSVAIDHAKAILGLDESDDAPSCDYIM